MSLVLTAAPAIEPVSLAEAKLHLRVDHTDEDAFIASLIVTSRLHVEAALGIVLVTQSWTERRDAWPAGREIELSLRPVQSIDLIRVATAPGTFTVLATTDYVLDGAAAGSRVVLHATATRPVPAVPASGIEIAFTAGYGSAAADVPAPIRHALLLLVAHWYERREPVEVAEKVIPLPSMVGELLAPYRGRRL